MEQETPIPSGGAVFLSDAHLNGDDLHAHTFVLLARKAAAEGIALFLLGDVFDLWFGTPTLTFGFQEPIISELRKLRREGLRIYYVEGNRDFHLKKHHEGTTFDAVSESDMRASVGPVRIHLTHGDAINRADKAYRFWKAISKNRLAFGAAALLPPSFVLPLAVGIERRLKPMNPRFKSRFPEEDIRDFARRTFAAGADVVVLGHFHTERLLEFDEEGKKVLAVLPPWREAWRYFRLAADGTHGFRAFRSDAPLIEGPITPPGSSGPGPPRQ
jgi:UDP-2,3-diacylglucosamine hydrolase